ncbi:uncharacterized protein DS421_1g26450 [Arachis hypogaea]|nr:uncharacterized protein DS421_1g26450 [Arachis hypogaea]
MKTKSRLSKSLNREAILAETFKYIHTLKANKEKFADERSTAHYAPSGNDKAGFKTSVVDPNRVWRETASEPYKNRHFGLGSFFASGLCSSVLVVSSTSVSATSLANSQEVVDLRKEVQKLTQELHQQAEQSE